MQRIFTLLVFVGLVLISISCDKGIEPAEIMGPSGFSGKITFVGKWPVGITRTHTFVFRNNIQSAADFSFLNLSAVVDPIPSGSSEFIYNSAEQNYIEHNFLPDFKIQPGEHRYVIVAQSTKPEISFNRVDWIIVGVYCINGDQSKPQPLIIQNGKITTGIDIMVDFNNLPPQPPM